MAKLTESNIADIARRMDKIEGIDYPEIEQELIDNFGMPAETAERIITHIHNQLLLATLTRP